MQTAFRIKVAVKHFLEKKEVNADTLLRFPKKLWNGTRGTALTVCAPKQGFPYSQGEDECRNS